MQMRCSLVSFVLSQSALKQQVIRGCYMVVPVSFDTFDGIVGIKIEFIQHLLVNRIIHWHDFFTGEETCRLLIFELFVPGVCTHVGYGVASVGISLQRLTNEVGAVRGQELGDFVVACENLLIQIGRFRVFKRQKPTDHRKQNHPTTPYIRFQPRVPLPSNHFGCCIARRPTGSFQRASRRLIHVGEAEIDYFE